MKQRIKALFVGGVLALALSGAAAAGPLDDVVAAYKSGDYAEAIRLLRPLAEQGNADAQSKLGVMYEKGQGVPTDYAAALALFRKAAEQGLAKAQSNLGSMYANGEGVLKDYAQAVAWYRKAADQGYALAQHNLGGMYYNGQGVPKDYVAAVALFRKAADQGFAEAQIVLGFMYENGQGVSRDYAEALVLFRKAADQGLALAQSNLGFRYERGQGVPLDYAKALALFRKAADQGFAEAQFNLGVMCANGEGVPKDDAQAVAWYRKAANQRYGKAQIALGNLYSEGHILPKNYVLADMWFRLAASTEADAADRERLAKLRDLLVLNMTAAQIDEAKKLASQWRAAQPAKVAALSPLAPEPSAQMQTAAIGPPVKYRSEIHVQKQGGTFLVPVSVNGVLTLNFIIDSGASDVSIPGDVFLTLMRSGTIQAEDFLGSRTYTLADGSSVPSETFRIRTLKVGDREIQNVTASVAKVKGDLLLGQSFLTRFKSWSIDNERGVLLLN